MKRKGFAFMILIYITTIILWSITSSAQSFFKGVHLVETPTTQATTGGTTSLTISSQTVQRFTGTSNQTIVLPDATTLSLGMYYLIASDATAGALTVKDNANTTLATVMASNSASFRLIANSVSAGTWSIENNYTAVPAGSISVSTPGGIAYGLNPSGLGLTAAGTSGQMVISQGTAAPSYFNSTAGSILYSTTSNVISSDFANLFYDSTNTRFKIGGGLTSITVNGSTSGTVLTASAQGGSNVYEFGVHRHNASTYPYLYLARSRGSETAPSIVQNGDFLGALDFLGYDGTDYEIGAQIDFVVDGTPGNNDMPGAILLKTTPDGGTAPQTAMSISQDKTVTLFGELDTALDVSGVLITSTAGVISSRAQLQLVNGGTNAAITASNGGVAFSTATAISIGPVGTSGQYLRSNGAGAPSWSAVSVSGEIVGILPLANGGTNANITASHGGLAYSTASAISLGPVPTAGTVLLGNGAAAYDFTAVGTSGQRLVSQGSAKAIWVSDNQTQGTRQTGTSISASTQITPVVGSRNIIFVVGNGGPVTVTQATPFVTTGMDIGQPMTVCGTSDANTVTYNNGNNLVLKGSAILGKDQCFTAMYSGSDGTNAAWVETARNF